MGLIIGISIAVIIIVILIISGYKRERNNLKHGTLQEDVFNSNYEDKKKEFDR